MTRTDEKAFTPEKAVELRARLERVFSRPVERIEPVHGGGYTPALRLRAILGGNTRESGFIKVATTGLTAAWLEREHQVYTALHAAFMPRLLAWDPAPGPDDFPLLALEDLSAAHWPPPWSARQIEQVRAALAELAAYPTAGLETVLEPLDAQAELETGWKRVAADPAPFLSLKIASSGWLERCLPVLMAACPPDLLRGSALVHLDVRSDNLCIAGDRVLLVDWNMACLGSPRLDFACWLPSLEMEGGPAPDSLLPDGGGYAAFLSGYFAAHAGLPIIPDAPFVRQAQRRQLSSALPWAIRALGLPGLY
jgi:hypothetical protein